MFVNEARKAADDIANGMPHITLRLDSLLKSDHLRHVLADLDSELEPGPVRGALEVAGRSRQVWSGPR
jgi:hypothetical protein